MVAIFLTHTFSLSSFDFFCVFSFVVLAVFMFFQSFFCFSFCCSLWRHVCMYVYVFEYLCLCVYVSMLGLGDVCVCDDPLVVE